METVDLVIQAALDFYADITVDVNGRYRSWEYCYYNFYKARTSNTVDVDFLSLHLAFYLASWGMYRGSSFLLQKDYKIHTSVVEKVLKTKYNILFGVNCEKLFDKEVRSLLQELSQFLTRWFKLAAKADSLEEFLNQMEKE